MVAYKISLKYSSTLLHFNQIEGAKTKEQLGRFKIRVFQSSPNISKCPKEKKKTKEYELVGFKERTVQH